jgi:predicted ester cyclase
MVVLSCSGYQEALKEQKQKDEKINLIERCPDFVLHNPVLPSQLTHGPEGVKKFAAITVDTIPDRQFIHHDTIPKGDKVLIRWTLTGTPKKDILGVHASDKPIDITGFDL